MESALAPAALKGRPAWSGARGRRCAAPLLILGWLALGACARPGAPAVAGSWRVGLGAADLAADPARARLAVACARSNDVWVLAAADGSLQQRIDTLPRPRAVLFHPERAAFYVAEGLSSVALVRLEDERVARRFRPRSRVMRMAYEPISGRILGAHQGSPTLGAYRLRDLHLEASVPVGGEVADLALDGRIAWLATRQADALVKLSLTDLSVKAAVLAGPDPRDLDLRPAADRALVACHGRLGEAAPLALPTPLPSPESVPSPTPSPPGEEDAPVGEEAEPLARPEEAEPAPPQPDRWGGGGLAVFRLSDSSRLDYLELPGGPVAVLADAGAKRAAVACDDGHLRVVDLERRRVVHTLALGGRPSAMLRHPDGIHLLVALSDQKTLLLVHPGGPW